MSGRLGDILVSQGAIGESQLQEALASQAAERGMLGAVLLRRGLVTIEQLGAALEQQFGVPFRQFQADSVHPQVVRLLPEDLARSRQLAPLGVEGDTMVLAMSAPDDIEAIAECELITGYRTEPVVGLEHEIRAVLDRGFDERIVARQTIVDMQLADLKKLGRHENADGVDNQVVNEAPVVRLVRSILIGAVDLNASDIHIEPHSPETRVRYRLDGELQQVMTIPEHIKDAVVARIKVMANMDTTEMRRPQDGRLILDEGGIRAHLRVSTIPTMGGEKVVMRILDEGSRLFSLDQLGLPRHDRQMVDNLLVKPHGMIVVTGPTGSGKSTTMYAMLAALNTVQRNIVTVEDPVEYRLAGITQIAADSEHGLAFANALKYIMRQDPDIIMVGEIRDHETAATAVQAALTGHLLISTLHTNDAVGAIARLNDLGVDPFKIGGALLGAIAQRLLRRICPHCKETCQPNRHLLQTVAGECELPDGTVFFRGRGCRHCLGTGYAGRLAVFETMLISPRLAEAIERKLPVTKLRDIAATEGMVGLASAGLQQALAGQTTVEEVFYNVMG